MSTVMLLLCYLPMTMIIIILPVVLYSMYNNCISIFSMVFYIECMKFNSIVSKRLKGPNRDLKWTK